MRGRRPEMGRASWRPRGCTRLVETGGQTIVLVVVAMVVFIGMLGMAIDVGYAFYVSRTMQSAADAAALAGAGQLPDTSAGVPLNTGVNLWRTPASSPT